VTVQTLRKISLPGRHCQCGALRAGNSKRCEKCQARSSWYRHNCRHTRRSAAHPAWATTRNDAGTRANARRSAEEH
jgi:hypothetical protein